MRLTHSPAELRKASEDVWYEVSMLLSVAQVLSSQIFGPGVATNAFLESFTIHARALEAFFFCRKQDPRDMVASDFFDEPNQWARKRGKESAVLKPVTWRVGKQVAHLSYVRLDVTPEAKDWDVPAIARAIAELADKFRKGAAPELLALKWPRR